jgi:predicted amidophosphoribosyltransferase
MNKSIKDQLLEKGLINHEPKLISKRLTFTNGYCKICGNELNKMGFCPQCQTKMR